MPIPVTFPGNPRQGWQFLVIVDGIATAYFEKAQIPELNVEEDAFNPAGSVRPSKFAGRFTIGDCTLSKGISGDTSEAWAWEWLTTAVDPNTGIAGLPAVYMKDIEIHHINRLGIPIQKFTLKDCWVKKVAYAENDASSSAHLVETVTLCVNDIKIN